MVPVYIPDYYNKVVRRANKWSIIFCSLITLLFLAEIAWIKYEIQVGNFKRNLTTTQQYQ